jgi:hypothetical protein
MEAPRDVRLDAAGWAARELNCGTGGLSPAAKQCVLLELAEGKFMPSPSRDAALRVVGVPVDSLNLPVYSLVWQAEVERLSKSVEAFAAEFFQLALSERLERFRSLMSQVEYVPFLVRRLNELAPAINIEPRETNSGSPEIQRLSRDITRLFVLPPRERKIQSRQFKRQWMTVDAGWANNLARLKEADYPLVALVPSIRPVKTPSVPAPRRVESARTAAGKRNPTLWIVIGVALAIIRLMGSTHSTTSDSGRPSYVSPIHNQPNVFNSVPFAPDQESKDTQEEIERLTRWLNEAQGRKSTNPNIGLQPLPRDQLMTSRGKPNSP